MSNLYYRGDALFLYVQFTDENNKPIDTQNPVVRILYTKGEETYDLLPEDFTLGQLGMGEYFANYTLDIDADYGSYEILYEADYGDKVASVVENFNVIPKPDVFENSVKIYGLVHQLKGGNPLSNTSVIVSSIDVSGEIIFQTVSKLDGYWEVHLYPGRYKFDFAKLGFINYDVEVEIGAEHNEIQFDNIALDHKSSLSKGNGIYLVTDKYTTKEGTPLNGLKVEAFNITAPTTVVASDNTNDDGEYEIYLDPGMYLLKVKGTSLMEDFNQTFRLKISENGKIAFENLTQNTTSIFDDGVVDNGYGRGSITVGDVITDPNGNPIPDVQISVYLKSNLNVMVAQDYTDGNGEWEVYLNPQTYIFEFYHPNFNEFSEERVVR